MYRPLLSGFRLLCGLIVAFFLWQTNAFAQLSGDVSGTLTLEDSPYCVTGDLTVPEGESLMIEAGVQLMFYGAYELSVLGSMQAIGTDTDWITFGPIDEDEGWRGIRFANNEVDTNRLVYCHVHHAKRTSSTNLGGGIYSNTRFIEIDHCLIEDCESGAHGGGIQFSYNPNDGFQHLTNSIIRNNTAGDDGGGMASLPSKNLVVSNCIFTGNAANNAGSAVAGGAMRLHGQGSPLIMNCTVTGNYATSAGAGIGSYYNIQPIILNCVLYGNTGGGGDLWNNGSGEPTVAYSCIGGGIWPGLGNIDADPMFLDPDNGNYYPMAGSPVIDAGEAMYYDISQDIEAVAPSTDYTDNERPMGEGYDMGAYETGHFHVELLPTQNECASDCNGAIDAVITGDTDLLSISWSNGDELEDIQLLCPDNYELTATFASGETPSASVNIGYQLPSPTADFEVDNTAVCNGGLFTFSNTSSLFCGGVEETGGLTYSWDFGTGTPTDLESPIQFINTLGENEVTLTATSPLGCTASKSVIITVFEAPEINLGNDTTICSNGSLLLDATIEGATYEWQDGSTAATYEVTTSGVYSVTVSLGEECIAEDEIVIDLFNPSNAGEMPADEQIVCSGESVSATASGVELSDGDVLNYALHTSATEVPGTILAQNATGTFDVSSGDIPYNTELYISSIVGPESESMPGTPDLSGDCIDIAAGTPVVFLAPVQIDAGENCDNETGAYFVSFSCTGGLPAYDSDFSYTVSGNFLGELSASGSEQFGPLMGGEGYSIMVTDDFGCSDEIVVASVPCLKVPIELISFTGEAIATGNLLNWVTASEYQNDYFSLERSIDGSTFELIATIDGAGTSTEDIAYDHLDVDAPTGISYYRLKQTDFDGQYAYSEVIALQRGTVETVDLQATYTSEGAQLVFTAISNDPIRLSTFDLLGRKVNGQTINNIQNGQNWIALPNLPVGVYVCAIVQHDQQYAVKVVISD